MTKQDGRLSVFFINKKSTNCFALLGRDICIFHKSLEVRFATICMKFVPSEHVSALAICDIYSPHSWHSNRNMFTHLSRDLTFLTAFFHFMRRLMQPAVIDAPHLLQSSPLPAFLSLVEEGVSWAPRPHTAPHPPARIDLHTYGIVCQGR